MSETILPQPNVLPENELSVVKNGQSFPKYRTIHQAVSYIKTIDPECSITECMVRKVIRDGDFKAKKIGSKYVVDLAQLLKFFDIYGGETDVLQRA